MVLSLQWIDRGTDLSQAREIYGAYRHKCTGFRWRWKHKVYLCLFVCLSFCRSVGLPACLPVCLSLCLSVCLSVCLALSVSLSRSLSLSLSLSLCSSPSICLVSLLLTSSPLALSFFPCRPLFFIRATSQTHLQKNMLSFFLSFLNNNNNERISRALFHGKHAQLR